MKLLRNEKIPIVNNIINNHGKFLHLLISNLNQQTFPF